MEYTVSLVQGPSEPALLNFSLGTLLENQSIRFPHREAVISAWTDARLTYEQLHLRSLIIAKSLIELGMKKGDRIGILSGNCDSYVELFFGATLIGVIVVVLNNTYTPIECVNSLEHSG